MSMKSIANTDNVIKRYGSRYDAISKIANKARKLREACYYVILDSQAVEWAISDVPPENLAEIVKAKIQKEAGSSKENRLTTILASIDEDNIREAVKKSYNLSTQNKQIMFDYNDIGDRGIRTRIRILTKLAFLE